MVAVKLSDLGNVRDEVMEKLVLTQNNMFATSRFNSICLRTQKRYVFSVSIMSTHKQKVAGICGDEYCFHSFKKPLVFTLFFLKR